MHLIRPLLFHMNLYNLRIVASETLHVLLENRAWKILSRPPGNILRLAILVEVLALTSMMLLPTYRIFPCQKLCNAAIEVLSSKMVNRGERSNTYLIHVCTLLQSVECLEKIERKQKLSSERDC